MQIAHSTRNALPLRAAGQVQRPEPASDAAARPEPARALLEHRRPGTAARADRRLRQYFAPAHHRTAAPRNQDRGAAESSRRGHREPSGRRAVVAARLSRAHGAHGARTMSCGRSRSRPCSRPTVRGRARRRLPKRCSARCATSPAPATCKDSAAVAFKSGEGVCQDHAHVYIASRARIGNAGPLRERLSVYRRHHATPPAMRGWTSGSEREIGWQSIDVTHQRPGDAHLLPARRRPRLSGCRAGTRRASRRRRREAWKPT